MKARSQHLKNFPVLVVITYKLLSLEQTFAEWYWWYFDCV